MADSKVYTIKEVSLIVDEEQHVLRYWEREFSFLQPQKNDAGNRMYTSKDLAIVKELKKFIRTERKTIPEARKAFLERFPDGFHEEFQIIQDEHSQTHDLLEIQSELEEILRTLKK
jgi:DNA-binding transcriptional MerR regulator